LVDGQLVCDVQQPAARLFYSHLHFSSYLPMQITLLDQPSMVAKSTTFDWRCACAILGYCFWICFFFFFQFFRFSFRGLDLTMSYFWCVPERPLLGDLSLTLTTAMGLQFNGSYGFNRQRKGSWSSSDLWVLCRADIRKLSSHSAPLPFACLPILIDHN